MNQNEEIENILPFAIDLARESGAILKKGFGTSFEIESKDGKHDLVTEYDKRVEDFIISSIRKKYPTHRILAEESGQLGDLDDGFCWIIDPLDGTVNFAHNIPMFAVSIALATREKIHCGVVYNPMVEELFHAQVGQGAYLNDKKIQVTDTNILTMATVATGFPYNVAENPLHCIDQFAHIAKLGIPIRRIGSAAIDMAYVAAGKFDAFWEVILNPWDFAAGALLIQEAKGLVTNLEGRSIDYFKRGSIVATNTLLHDQALEHLHYYED